LGKTSQNNHLNEIFSNFKFPRYKGTKQINVEKKEEWNEFLFAFTACDEQRE